MFAEIPKKSSHAYNNFYEHLDQCMNVQKSRDDRCRNLDMHDEQKKCEGARRKHVRMAKKNNMAWRRMEDGSDEEDTRFIEIQLWEGEEDEEHVLVT